MTRHDAHIGYYASEALYINEWWMGGHSKPIVRTAVGAVARTPSRLLGAVPGRGLVADRLDERRYAEQQSRLRRLGFLAAVDGTPLGEHKRHLSRRDRVMSIFQENKIFERGRVVGIQPVVYATASREQGPSLARRAKTLSTAIDAKKAGGETLFNAKPIVVDGQRKGAAKALYGAVNEAAVDLERKVQDLTGESDGTYRPSPSLIIVMGAGHIARTLQGPSHDEVVRSGVVILDEVGPLPKDNIWTPRFALSPYDTPSTEPELPVPLELPELVPVREPRPAMAQPYTSVYS